MEWSTVTAEKPESGEGDDYLGALREANGNVNNPFITIIDSLQRWSTEYYWKQQEPCPAR